MTATAPNSGAAGRLSFHSGLPREMQQDSSTCDLREIGMLVFPAILKSKRQSGIEPEFSTGPQTPHFLLVSLKSSQLQTA